uniref:Uncharacterized protein n=1 Tax=Arundo donax TaxID=35708 RepID=A0A0A9H2Z9_ARUDO
MPELTILGKSCCTE